MPIRRTSQVRLANSWIHLPHAVSITRVTAPMTRSNCETSTVNCFGCGYFLATRKAAKNQVILGVATAKMTGNSRVIEVREEYPPV